MKQYVILILAIVIILTFNFWQITYLESTSRYLLTDIADLKYSIARKDIEGEIEAINNIDNTWSAIRPGWDIFAEHDDIEDISEKIASLYVYAENDEKVDLINEYSNLANKIEHIVDGERFKIENIF